MKAKPPFKLALAAMFLDEQLHSAQDAFVAFAPSYAGCAFFNENFVATALQSLKAVGILKVDDSSEETRYLLTEYGTRKVQHNL